MRRADLHGAPQRLAGGALVVRRVERHDVRGTDADDEDERRDRGHGLAPLYRPARTRRRPVSGLLLLLCRALLLLFPGRRLRALCLFALDLLHVIVVLADRHVLLGLLRLVLLAFLGHRRHGGSLGLAPDLLGFALAALVLLRAAFFLLGAALLFLAPATCLLGQALLFLLGRAPSLGFFLDLAIELLALGLFLRLLFVVLAGEALEVSEQRIGEVVLLLRLLRYPVARPGRRFDVRHRGRCRRGGAFRLRPRLRLHLGARLGLGFLLELLALGRRLGFRFLAGLGEHGGLLQGRPRRLRGWPRWQLARAKRAEIEVTEARLGRGFGRRLWRRLRCRRRGCGLRRGGAGRAGGHLADEAVLVELVDDALEGGVEGLADSLRHIGERGTPVYGSENCAVCSLQEARLPRSLLHPLPRLRVDGGRIHFLAAIILVRRAVPAASRTFDDEYVAGRHLGLVERPELGVTSVGAQHVISSTLARFAAPHAVRRHEPVAGQDRRGHRLEEAHAPDGTVAAAPAAAAARAGSDFKALEAHRKAPLEHFRIGEPRVRHVRLHHIRAVVARTRARAAADRLVVLIAVVAVREIVHRALRRGHDLQRAIERLGQALRGLDVPRDHRRRVARLQHAALRDDDVQRFQAAGVQ